MEIRGGAGGEEAALFAQDLFKMYSKYAETQGWEIRILDSNQTEIGGLKQIIFEIKGENADLKMKYEGGVHRVQSTSTVSVAVLEKPESTQIKLNPSDLRIDFFKASGPGGQYVNKRQTAVRITHLPTNLVVSSQNSRNLEENKKAAFNILEARLFEKEKMEIENKIAGERKTQIGRAQRSEKIRTYNFPQDRITDHRINKKFHNIEKILAGNLNPIVKALQKSIPE